MIKSNLLLISLTFLNQVSKLKIKFIRIKDGAWIRNFLGKGCVSKGQNYYNEDIKKTFNS